MHPDFADWYRVVEPAANTALLGRRWKAVESFCKAPSSDNVLHLVRLHYGIGDTDQFEGELRDAFKRTDATFPNRGNQHLLAVLAGSCLAKLLRERGEMADTTALAVVSASFLKYRNGAIVDLLDQATSYLHTASLSRGEDDEMRPMKGVPLNVEDLKAKLEQYCKPDATLSHLASLLHDILTKLAGASTRLAGGMNALNRWQQLQHEELTVLWWLFGEHSRDLNIHFAELGMPAASLIAAKELVDLVSVLPGPYSASAFIDKALCLAAKGQPTSITLYDAVNACDRDWRKAWVSSIAVDNAAVCPVILAVRKSLESTKKAEWVPAFETLTGLKARQQLNPMDLSMQTYHEALLVRCLIRE